MKTVITFGTYDLFHIGHLRILQRARAMGDRLVVGVSTDALNMAKKNYKPIFAQEHRLEIIRALSCVSEAFFEESLELKASYIKQHKAEVLVMGDDWRGKFDNLRSICNVFYLPRTEGISTTMVKDDVIQKALR